MASEVLAAVLEVEGKLAGPAPEEHYSFNVEFDHGKSDFTAGEQVRGALTLTIDHELPIRGVRASLVGREKAYWAPSLDGRYSDVFQETRVVVDEEHTLFGKPPLGLRELAREFVQSLRSEEAERRLHVVLPPGTHRFPFEFRLPLDAPPDYVSRFGSECSYAIVGSVDVPFAKDLRTSRRFTVYEIHARPDDIRPVEVSASHEFWLDKNPLLVTLSVPTNAFYVGDAIKQMELLVDNRSSHALKGVRIALFLREVCRPQGQEFTNELQVHSEYVAVNVPAHSRHRQTLPFALPRNMYASIYSAKLFTVTHFLHFSFDISWATRLVFDLPIILLERPGQAAHDPSLSELAEADGASAPAPPEPAAAAAAPRSRL
jgi:hypothetical protein